MTCNSHQAGTVTPNRPNADQVCAKCGRFMPVTAMERDPVLERAITVEAAKRHGIRADALAAFADSRAGEAAVRDVATRDFVREIAEELADARNYAVWEIRRLQASHAGGPVGEDVFDRIGRVQRVLGAVTLAYHELLIATPD